MKFLNILHTIDLDTLYPILRCEIDFSKNLNVKHLKKALKLVGKIIPEIFGAYDFNKNEFLIKDHNVDKIVINKNGADQDENPDIESTLNDGYWRSSYSEKF